MAVEPGPLIVLCLRERAPIQADERQRPCKGKGWIDATDPSQPQPVRTSLTTHPSPWLSSSTLGLKVRGSGVNIAALLLEEKGRCTGPVMSNTEIAGREAEKPPSLPCFRPFPDSNYSATCQLKNNRSRSPQLTSRWEYFCLSIFQNNRLQDFSMFSCF